MTKKLELVGRRFGRLLVLKKTSKRENNGGVKWRCLCECGEEKETLGQNLTRGKTRSCGCLRVDSNKKKNTVHGLVDHRLYTIYMNIRQRLFNKKSNRYEDYGGRGITMCDEWRENFFSFYAFCLSVGYEDHLNIDRIDNDGNYEPGNCHFVSALENNHNQRMRKDNTSGYRGVSKRKTSKKYKSAINHGKKTFHLGHYITPKEAAIVRDKYVIDNNLPHTLNFPELRGWIHQIEAIQQEVFL